MRRRQRRSGPAQPSKPGGSGSDLTNGADRFITSVQAQGSAQPVIGLITKTETNPFFVKMKEGAQKEATRLGAKLLTAAGKTDGDNAAHVTAIGGADFELRPGEIMAVIGDNGAGKSSLIKALSGALIPDEGEIRLDGRSAHFRTPSDARREGIETVYQDLAVAPAMTIAENLQPRRCSCRT